MSLTDFEFNGRRVSEFGCMVCTFNSVGLETVDIGTNLALTTIKRQNYFHTISTKYEEPFTTTIQICKHECDNKQSERYFEDNLVSYLMKWLLSKTNRKFKMIYDDTKCYDMYYIGTFTNIHALKIGENILGLELTFTANAPFGFYESFEFDMDFSDINTEYCISDVSDEEGYIYPHILKITILQDGNLEIKNTGQDESVIITDCTEGEVITLDGNNKLITSNMRSSMYNNFNYKFIKITNNIGDGFVENKENIFTVSSPCNILLSYSPICKMGVI